MGVVTGGRGVVAPPCRSRNSSAQPLMQKRGCTVASLSANDEVEPPGSESGTWLGLGLGLGLGSGLGLGLGVGVGVEP